MLARLKAAAASVAHAVWTRLRHEPVAVWGVCLAAAVGVLKGAGVDDSIVQTIWFVAGLVGIPVVRRRVTPYAALQALLRGAAKQR